MSNEFDVTASTPYDEVFNQVSRDTGMPVEYLKAVAFTESGMNPNAVSDKGALGLMQVMPKTGLEMGYSPEQLQTPEGSIQAGGQYLKPLYEQQGPYGAWAGYNMGPTGFQNAGGDPYSQQLPGETIRGVNVLRQLYGPHAVQGPQQEGNWPTVGQPQQQQLAGTEGYRDPFSPPGPGNDLTQPAQPVYGNQQQGQSPVPGPPMGASQGQPGGQPGAGSAASQSPFNEDGQGPPNEFGQDPQAQGQVQDPQARFQPPPGTLSLPDPQKDPGFWETLRIASEKSPGTFYMVLADLARLNLDGIKQTMLERERQMIARERTAAMSGGRYNAQAQRRIDKIRSDAARGGWLDEYETEHGLVDTEEELAGLQSFSSKKRGEEKEVKERTALSKNLDIVLKRIGKTGGIVSKAEAKVIADWYGEDGGDVVDEIRQRSLDIQNTRKEEMTIKRDRLALARESFDLRAQQAVNADAKYQVNLNRRDYSRAVEEAGKARVELETAELMSKYTDYDPGKLLEIQERVDKWEARIAEIEEEYDIATAELGLRDYGSPLNVEGGAEKGAIKYKRNTEEDEAITEEKEAMYEDLKKALGDK